MVNTIYSISLLCSNSIDLYIDNAHLSRISVLIRKIHCGHMKRPISGDSVEQRVDESVNCIAYSRLAAIF